MTKPDLSRWTAVADSLHWSTAPTQLYAPEDGYGRWFAGGALNAAVNCVDRHLRTHADRPAIHWEGEPGDRRTLTFADLHAEVVAAASALRGLGVRPGDRVALHLGGVPEAVVVMLACARIGAPFAVLPMPLPVDALAERLIDLRPRVLFTQDGAWRHGVIIPTKARIDDALTAVDGVERTVVVRRTGLDVSWYEGDRWLHELLAPARSPGGVHAEPAAVPADHPLLILGLANRRGRPVTVVHETATLLAGVAAAHRYGVSPGGVSWCLSDPASIAAQAHGVIGPLLWGDTTVMYEGTLDVPNHCRLWDIVQRYDVATLLVTPSILDRVRGWAAEAPSLPKPGILRRVVLMGEPLHPALRDWVADQVTGDPDAVVDAWGQVELGGVVIVDRPADPDRLPDPGLAVVDAEGEPVPDGVAGELVLRKPWAGMMRRPADDGGSDPLHHWHRPGVYSTGDRVVRRGDAVVFLGRIDPVVSVSGQLVSLTEVRDVLLDHPFVAAAEVVARVDGRLGRSIAACIVPAAGVTADETLATELVEAVRETLGGLARPRTTLFVDRFGAELSTNARRRALELLAATAPTERPSQLSWGQVLSAALASVRRPPP